MKKFIITEEEKKNILSMYSVLNEQIMGEQKIDVSKFIGKTYKLYLNDGGKSVEVEWDNKTDTHPSVKQFLPTGQDYFDIKIKGLSYFSASTNYSFSCERIVKENETYRIPSMFTDIKLLSQSKFKVTLTYTKPDSKSNWSNEVFYGYSDELKTDLNNNGIK